VVARILLVEDDPDVRPLMQHVLFGEGHAVDAVATLAAARALLEVNRYDLLLADAELPDGKGTALAREARERGLNALIVTGYALRLSEAELDGHAFLMKPVRPQELLRAVALRLASETG
jgi:DNA-binding response OmpR family regulator